MHVAVDITPVTWPGRSGVACVAANLARALARYAPQHDFTMIAPRPLNPAYGADLEPAVLGGGFAGYWSFGLPRFIRTTKCDALIVTSPEPIWASIPTAAIVYDVYPMFYRRWLTRRRVLEPTYWKLQTQTRLRLSLIRRTGAIICISAQTAEDVARLAPRVRGKVSVALPGVNPAPHARIPGQPREYLLSLGVRPPFILYVGAVNAQKDVRTLTAAHMVLQKEQADLQLVVAGRQTWPYDHGAVRDHPSVVRLAEVSDELLGALYSQCHVFVQPSRYEGFGLTALEAMSFGAPVVVSDGGALPEVVGPAGSTYPAGDAVALTEVLRSLLSHPAERALAARRSCDRAAQFSWEAMATGVIEALTKAANTFSERA